MDKIFELSNLELTSISFIDFAIGLLTTSLFILLVRLIYIRYSNTVSNKTLTANLFFIFGISIYLIVVTIKSSIVLSLGLVGALSIIRFRTAIKEPEQIVYFLFVTGIAIATAAESFIFPLLSVLTLFLYVSINNRKQAQHHFSQNDQVIIECNSIDNITIEKLITDLNDKGVNVEIQSMSKDKYQTLLVLKLSDFSINHLEFLEKFLNDKNIENLKIQFFSSPE
jgi:hypothetical protein